MALEPVHPRLKLMPYISLVGAGILIFTGLFSLAPSLPALRQHFIALPNIDVLVQIVGAGAAFTFAIGCLLSGRIIERAGYRPIYIGSLLTMGVFGPAAALIENIYFIIVTRAIVGFAVAGVVNSVLVAINRLLDEQGEARALGLQGTIGSVAAILIFPFMGFLTSLDWRLAFSAHLIAFMFLPLALMLPVTSSEKDAQAEPGNFASAARNVGALVGGAAVFSGMVIFALAMFGPLLVLSLGITDPQLQSLPPTATVIGSAVGSWLTISLRTRFTLRRLLALTLFVEFMGLGVIALSTSFPGVIAGTLLGGLGTGLVAPILYGCVIKASTGNPATGLGLVNALIYGAMILFPLVAMPLAQLIGSSRLMLMLLAGCGLMLMIPFLLPSSSKRPSGPAVTKADP